MEILDVTADNVDQLGFFCYMSKRKSEGYQRKLAWVKDRFPDGLRIKMLAKPDRGFIESMPGETAWRGIQADGYQVIHCLWVVGKSRKNGYAKALLQACVDDARAEGKKGVAVVASEGNWLIGKKFFEKQGWECADTAEPSFSLMVQRFDERAGLPRFASGWDEHAAAHPEGVTVFHSGQCPYIADAVSAVTRVTGEAGLPCSEVEVSSREQLLSEVPSPYGVFSIVKDGRLLSYHYLLEKDLPALLD